MIATENLAPQVISRLMGEIRDIVKNPAEGVEYIENDENSVTEIHAIITGPGKLYFIVILAIKYTLTEMTFITL